MNPNNKTRLVKMRPELINMLDNININRIMDILYTKRILNEEHMSDIRSNQVPTDRRQIILDLLKKNVDFEDKNGKTETFDIFLNALNECDLGGLVQKLKDLDIKPLAEPSKTSGIKSILQTVKDRKMHLNQKLLSDIVENIGKGWQNVARRLGIDQFKIDDAKEEKLSDVNEQKFQVFNGWRNAHNFNEDGTIKLLETLKSTQNCVVNWERIEKIIKDTASEENWWK